MKKKIMLLVSIVLPVLIFGMEFKIIDFYEDIGQRYENHYSSQTAEENSVFFLVIKTNFDRPFSVLQSIDYHKFIDYPDTYLYRINSDQKSITFRKDNYESLEYQFPENCIAGKQYVIEVSSVAAYYLKIEFDPLGGECKIDDNKYLYGMSTLQGEYEITYFADGYEPFCDTIIVDENNYHYSFQLTKIPLTTCTFEFTPPDAKLFLDGKFRGNSPCTLDLDAGKYSLSIQKDAYHNFEEEIEIEKGIDADFNFNLIPFSFYIQLDDIESVVSLKKQKGDFVKLNSDSTTYFTDLENGDYRLTVSNPKYSTLKQKFSINDQNYFHKQITLNRKFTDKLFSLRKDMSFNRGFQNFLYSKFQTTFHKIDNSKNETFTGFEFRNYLRKKIKSNIITPFYALNFISCIDDINGENSILLPNKFGLNVNFLGDSRFNITPEFSLNYLPIYHEKSLYTKNWGYSFGVDFDYWLTNNIGINLSYEKSKYHLDNEDNRLPDISNMDSYKMGISYVISNKHDALFHNNKSSDINSSHNIYDELVFAIGTDSNDLNSRFTGWEYYPRLSINQENTFLLPLISIKKYNLYNHELNNTKAHLYMTNFGIKLNAFSGNFQCDPFFTVGWAPYSLQEDKFYSDFQTKSFIWNTGIMSKYWFNNYVSLSLGADYTTFFKKKDEQVSDKFNFSSSNKIFTVKAGIGFNLQNYYNLKRQLDDIDFSVTINSFNQDYFNENIGIELCKYFDSETKIIQLIRTSLTEYKNKNDKMYIGNINYGVTTKIFSNTFQADFLPYCSIGYEPVKYEFSNFQENPYLNDNQSANGEEFYKNFSWNGGIDLKFKFKKVGFKIGYGFTKAFSAITLKNNATLKTNSDKLVLGIFF